MINLKFTQSWYLMVNESKKQFYIGRVDDNEEAKRNFKKVLRNYEDCSIDDFKDITSDFNAFEARAGVNVEELKKCENYIEYDVYRMCKYVQETYSFDKYDFQLINKQNSLQEVASHCWFIHLARKYPISDKELLDIILGGVQHE